MYTTTQPVKVGITGFHKGNVPVVFAGGCPRCGRVIRNEYCTCCGVLWSILLFPCGLFCLLACKEKRCDFCGYRYK